MSLAKKRGSKADRKADRKAELRLPLDLSGLTASGDAFVFCDVDGVLLSFDELINIKLVEWGREPIAHDVLETRLHDYLSEAFPHLFSRDEGIRLVTEVFTSGHLKTQPGFSYLYRGRMGQLLAHERLMILTRLHEVYASDRVKRLKEVYGVDFGDGRFFTMWDGTTKGEVMARVCGERGIDISLAVLIDDRHDNVEGALRVGASGVLVRKSYNAAYELDLAARHPGRFFAVDHDLLPEAISLLLAVGAGGSVSTETTAGAAIGRESKQTQKQSLKKQRTK